MANYRNQLMSDVIRLLPDSVANQIAAGEVIQRPASVVKELVENAVDAGSKHIQVIIKDAGRTLIQVVDDGCGMSATDARLAFERHATSKIAAASDLFELHTMGFRGEALASIAAVAQVELRTMPHGEDIGTRIVINGSKVESQKPEACAPGSNMMVKNLFFNVPARRKFLHKDTVEMSNILREFERLALVNPGLDLELVSNDVVIHKLLPSTLKQRISDLFGKGLDKQLLPIGTETSIVKIDGFVGRPEFARRRSPLQYFTVNGRHMRHPYFHKGVMLCYDRLISGDSKPSFFINFTVDPQTIDVNIHPTKNEIKFENESAIQQILMAAVKESLGSFNAMPAIDFDDKGGDIDIPVFNPDSSHNPGIEIDPNYNPFSEGSRRHCGAPTSSGSNVHKSSSLTDWEKLYEGFTSQKSRSSMGCQASQRAIPSLLDGEVSAESDIGAVAMGDQREFASLQLRNRFIITPSKSGLMVVEQHRAHHRVLFEKYCKMLNNHGFVGQQVLFSEIIELTPEQGERLAVLTGLLKEVGFEVEKEDGGGWRILSVPSLATDVNPRELLTSILDNTAVENNLPEVQLRRRMASAMASASAIRVGQALTASEREQLLEDLFVLPAPNYTDDGKLIVSIVPLDRISEQF